MSHFSADAAEFQPSGTAWQLDAVGDALAAGSEAEQPQEMGLSPLVASAVAALGSLDGAALLQLAHGDQATLERTCLQLLGLPPPPTEPPTAPEVRRAAAVWVHSTRRSAELPGPTVASAVQVLHAGRLLPLQVLLFA